MSKKISEKSNLSFGIGLSGGGARSGAHIGVLNVLNKHIDIEALSGVSAGAIVAVSYAAGKLKKLERFIKRQDKKTIMRFLKYSKHQTGLFDSAGIEKFMREIVGDVKLQDLNIPVFICASDILHGTEVYFKRGDAAKIVAASSAIPLVFTPVRIRNRLLMDGGIFNDIPTGILKGKADKVIAVNVGNNTTFLNMKEEYITKRFKTLENKAMYFERRLHKNNKLSSIKRLKLMNAFSESTNKLSKHIHNITLKLKESPTYYNLAERMAESFSQVGQGNDLNGADYLIRPNIKTFNLDFLRAKQTIKPGEYAAKEFLRKHKLIKK